MISLKFVYQLKSPFKIEDNSTVIERLSVKDTDNWLKTALWFSFLININHYKTYSWTHSSLIT